MLSTASSCLRSSTILVKRIAGPRSSLLSVGRTKAFTTAPENPLQARAKQMHNEIENIVKKHDHNRQQEAEKMTKFAGFVDFLKKNKTNLSVIVVSFLTVVLSAKMVQNKQKYVDVQAQLEQTESQLDEKRKLLKAITSQEFLSNLAENCASEISAGSKKGWRRGSSDSKEAIIAVLSRDLSNRIGDAGLTEDEILAKQLEQLRAKGKDIEDAAIEKLSALSQTSGEASTSTSTTEEWVEDADGKKTVKKSVFRI